MFFEIAHTACVGLPVHHRVGEWVISTDLGWQSAQEGGTTVLTKGLPDSRCELRCDGQRWQIHHNELRAFPLWQSTEGDRVGNFTITKNWIYNRSSVIHDGSLRVEYQAMPDWVLDEDRPLLSRGEAVDRICDNLVRQAGAIADLGLPIIAYDTQGVDSATLRALLDYCGVAYHNDRVSDTRIETKPHLADAQPFWAYGLIVDDGSEHIEACGFNGDEVMTRNPIYAKRYLEKFNIDLESEFDRAGDTYMSAIFEQDFRKAVRQLEPTDRPHGLMYDQLFNDFQIWHIDRCHTWTPFVNEELIRLCTSVDPDTAVAQCLDAQLSKDIIKRFNPARLDDITKQKIM